MKENVIYDNYMDKNSKHDDQYRCATLDEFMPTSEDGQLIDQTKAKHSSEAYKEIRIHFRNIDDLIDFCEKINFCIGYKTKSIWYPLYDVNKLPLDEDVVVKIDKDLMIDPKDRIVKESKRDESWKKHWKSMPEFTQEKKSPARTIKIKFRNEEDIKKFGKKIGQNLSEKTKSIWFPKLEKVKNKKYRWIEDGSNTSPKYPVFIVSKGRSDTMLTSRSLNRMRVQHFILIEPQDEKDYIKALDNFNLKYAKLVIAPFSNHGDGPGRARNYVWQLSEEWGHTAHWVMDDNISDFYRLHENIRIRIGSGAGFRAMEDFFDRYENLYIAGPQYRFFIAPDGKYPAYVANTRIYSCLLIRNDCKHKWRGRYNEDTDLCLRVLKDGDCTVQFNAFLQDKIANQTLKGGNTAEFYHVEGDTDPSNWKEGINATGTINKSKMLVDMHPDVTRLVFRYKRWHHWVDYSGFKRNLLILKDGINVPDVTNNYNMTLINDYDGD